MNLPSVALNLGVVMLLFGFISGAVRLWGPSGMFLVPAGSRLSIIGAALIAAGWFWANRSRHLSLPTIGVGLLLLICTDWITRDYSFIRGHDMRGAILVGTLIAWTAIQKRCIDKALQSAALLGAIYLLFCFINAANGSFIFSDDHSVVLFRLQLLKENFPFIPFFNPLWNMGLDARDFFATGILNLFTLASPIIYLTDLKASYHMIIGLAVFVLFPTLMYLAVRMDKGDKTCASLTAILALTNNLFWYRWALKYGSMGFVTSAMFVLLNIVLCNIWCSRHRELDRRFSIIFVTSLSLMLCWSLIALLLAPVVAWGLWRIRVILSKRYSAKIIMALLAINLPWMILFASVSKVFDFVSLSSSSHKASNSFSDNHVKGKAKLPSLQTIEKKIKDNAAPINPLILLFAIPGLMVMSRSSSRNLIAAVSLWLFILGVVVAPLKPQLELDRALILCGLIGTYPTSVGILHLLRSSRGHFENFISALVLGTLLAGIVSAGVIIYNRSVEKYTHADSVYFDLGKAISENAGGGRAVFAGFVLHELNQGHLAPLSLVTSAPLAASTLFHNVWKYTDIMPKEFLAEGDKGFERFFDLANASLVIAHEKKWRDYLFNNPDSYTFIGRYGVFNLFRRAKYIPSYFIEGRGSVISQNSSSVNIKLETPEAVIKFRYFPFLRANGCKISPFEAAETLTLIRLSECDTSAPITIKAKTGFARLWSRN